MYDTTSEEYSYKRYQKRNDGRWGESAVEIGYESLKTE